MPWYFQTVTWVVWLKTYHASYEVDLHSIMDPAFACRGSAEPNSRSFWSTDVSVTFLTIWFCCLWRWCLILRVSEFKSCCSSDIFIHSNQFTYWCLPNYVFGQVSFSRMNTIFFEEKINEIESAMSHWALLLLVFCSSSQLFLDSLFSFRNNTFS